MTDNSIVIDINEDDITNIRNGKHPPETFTVEGKTFTVRIGYVKW